MKSLRKQSKVAAVVKLDDEIARLQAEDRERRA